MHKICIEFGRFVASTHIRILAFSPAKIKSCVIRIDDGFKQDCTRLNDSLFVVPWNPQNYKDGLHYITVIVVDGLNRENQVNQPFKLDEEQTLRFDFRTSFALNVHFRTIIKSVFWVSFALTVVPLVIFRIWHELIRCM